MAKILILGARSDIAAPLAKQLAKCGHDLILAARKSALLSTFAADLKLRYSSDVSTVEFDVLDYSSHPAFYENLPEKPDGVICMVGYLGKQPQTKQDKEEISLILKTNFTACVSIIEIIAADFSRRKHGFIVGVSSVAGERGKATSLHYSSAKAGFTAYLSGLRNKLAKDNVRVITILPGYVRTKMIENLNPPSFLVSSPERVASDIVKAINGQKDIVYTIWYWRYLMTLVKLLPEMVFKRLSL